MALRRVIISLQVLLALIHSGDGFTPSFTPVISSRLLMKSGWSFDKGMGSLKDLGAIGSEGELYFHPTKQAKLSPSSILGKNRNNLPIFPQQNILLPGSSEWIHVFEMRNRQLLNDVGDGVFGFSFTSQALQKLALVGTLARIKQRKILEDGRTFVQIEGIDRFYIQEVVNEKPYIKSRVQEYHDFSETTDYVLDMMEAQIFDEVRFNMKLMKILFPTKNYSLSQNVLQNRPALTSPGVRAIKTVDPKAESERRSKFSFSIVDILQIPVTTKLLLLQEHIIERRYSRILKALERGGTYLADELKSRGILTDEGIRNLRRETLADFRDVELYSSSSW